MWQFLSGVQECQLLSITDVSVLVPEVIRLPGANNMMGRPQFQKESQMYAKLAAWLGQNQVSIIGLNQSKLSTGERNRA